MSPDDTKDPNAEPDFSSVPLPEENPIRSPYAPATGTLGDVADDLDQPASAPATSAPEVAPEPAQESTPMVDEVPSIPQAGILKNEEELATNTTESSVEIPTAGAITQSNTSAPTVHKSHKKLFLFGGIGLVAVAAIVVAVVLIINGNNGNGSGGNGSGNGKTGEVFASKPFFISNYESRSKYALVSASGEKKSDFVYTYYTDFMDGYAAVSDTSGWGIIDEKNNYTVNSEKCSAISIFGGLYGCTRNESNSNLLLDGAGNTVLEYTTEFDNYDNFVLGGRSAYTIVKRENNKYDLYNTRGALVESFESSSDPTISTLNSNTPDSITMLAYDGKVKLFSDNDLKELRSIDVSLKQKYYLVDASVDKEILILSTEPGAVLPNAYGDYKIPTDDRLNAVISGTILREYSSAECAAVAYMRTTAKTGYAACLNQDNRRFIKNDGEVETKLGLGRYSLNDNLAIIDTNHYITGEGSATIGLYVNGSKAKTFKSSTRYSGEALGDVYAIEETNELKENPENPYTVTARKHKVALYDKNGSEMCVLAEETNMNFSSSFSASNMGVYDDNGISIYKKYPDPLVYMYNQQCEIVGKYSFIERYGPYYSVKTNDESGKKVINEAIIDKDGNTIDEGDSGSIGYITVLSPERGILLYNNPTPKARSQIALINRNRKIYIDASTYNSDPVKVEDNYLYVRTHKAGYLDKEDQDTYAWYTLDGKLIYGEEYKEPEPTPKR